MPSEKSPDGPHGAAVVNLRMARKAKRRQAAVVTAAQNRAVFGRAKAERQATEQEKQVEARRLDGLRRSPIDPPT